MSIKIHYSFIVYILVLFFLDLLNYYILFFLSIIIHEFTHGVLGRILGLKVNSVHISITGLSIKFKDFNISKAKKIIILLAGPIINLLISVLIYLLFKEKYIFFAMCNFILFTFNILPIYPLDGGKVLYEILKDKKRGKRILNLIEKSFAILLIVICIYFYINFYAIQILFLGIYLLGFVNIQKYNKYFLNNN